MEDVTDTVFRGLIREWSRRLTGGTHAGPAVMFTEFTRVDAVERTLAERSRGRPGNGRLLFADDERPIIAQLWGTRPEEFVIAAAGIRELGFDGIDLNMGCPVRKIRKAGACSQLIANPSLAGEIIAACREGSSLPLSVKTRIGLSSYRTEEWCGFLLEQGVDALTVHPRTADQMSEGAADWREVARVVEMRNGLDASAGTVILGNGDVGDLATAARRIGETGADGVMIGRGIFADPLLFARGTPPASAASPAPAPVRSGGEKRSDVAGYAASGASAAPGGGPLWAEVPLTERLGFLREHIIRFDAFWGDTRNYEVLKKFFRNYLTPEAAMPDDAAEGLLARLYTTTVAAEALALIDASR
jgi:tRNA-dihydrouridine synthase